MINNECNKGSNVFNSIKTKKDTINLELNIINVTKGGNVLDSMPTHWLEGYLQKSNVLT